MQVYIQVSIDKIPKGIVLLTAIASKRALWAPIRVGIGGNDGKVVKFTVEIKSLGILLVRSLSSTLQVNQITSKVS